MADSKYRTLLDRVMTDLQTEGATTIKVKETEKSVEVATDVILLAASELGLERDEIDIDEKKTLVKAKVSKREPEPEPEEEPEPEASERPEFDWDDDDDSPELVPVEDE